MRQVGDDCDCRARAWQGRNRSRRTSESGVGRTIAGGAQAAVKRLDVPSNRWHDVGRDPLVESWSGSPRDSSCSRTVGWIMRAFRASLALVLLGACGDAARTLGPTDYVVSGVWRFEQYLTGAAGSITCATYGDITVVQDGPRFTAEGTQSGYCDAPGGSQIIADEPVTILDGTIDGTTFAFHADECAYTGTAYGAAPDSVAGSATCRVQVSGSLVTLQGDWHVIPPPDDVPPSVSGTPFGGGRNGTLETGDDTLYVRIVAEDNTALRAIGYEIRDPSRLATVRSDSLVLSVDTVGSLDDTLIFPLPLDLILPVPPGTPFEGSVFARDTAGNVASAALAPMTVRAPDPPTAAGGVSGATRPDSAAALRDTLEIAVTVESPRALTYIGYRLTNFASLGDSVAVTDTAASHVFRLAVPFEWKGLLLEIEVFGRDRLGLEDRAPLGQLRVAVFPSRPTQTFRVGQGVSEVVHDPARQRVYLMTAVDTGPATGTPEVRVLQLSPAGFLPGIALPWFADGMDLSPGGDSLLVTLYNGRLGIVDLNILALDSTASIAFPPSNGRYPFKVRAMANGTAMISIASAYWGAGDPGLLVQLDLATGTQTLRTDVGTAGAIGLTPLLARTPDRTRLVVYPSRATASEAQLYQSATNAFGVSLAVPAPPVGVGSVSSDAAGTRWLVGNQLLDGGLAWLRELGTGLQAGTSVLSHDGVYAYVSVPEGVAKYRTADGTRAELILLQEPPYRLAITPDGSTLIGVGYGLQIVDLR